jgi:hypothetical protein
MCGFVLEADSLSDRAAAVSAAKPSPSKIAPSLRRSSELFFSFAPFAKSSAPSALKNATTDHCQRFTASTHHRFNDLVFEYFCP